MARGTVNLVHYLCVTLATFATICTSQLVFDVEELSVQYGIEISNKPVVLNSHSDNANVLQLSSKHGQTYSCILPPPVLPQDDEKESSHVNTDSVANILDKSFNGSCLTHKKGWWTYKLCHKDKITQYHVSELGEVSGPVTLLGEYQSEYDWSKEEAKDRKPSEQFHSHQYSKGHICDVTHKMREATVQYFCDVRAKDDIIRIEEPATCEYIISVSSIKLCSHPLFFKKEKKKQVNLVCSPALLQHEFNKYTEKMNRKKSEAMEKLIETRRKAEEEQNAFDALNPGDAMMESGEKLKDSMNSFMKGFMNVLNINKGETEKTTAAKVLRRDADDNDVMTQTDLGMADKSTDETDVNVRKEMEQIKNLEKAIDKLDQPDGSDQKLPHADKKGKTVKNINDITASMIKQLETDSKNMKSKAAKERDAMHTEFDRVHKESMKELKRARSLLDVLKAVKQSTKVQSSRERVEKQLKFVSDLVNSLEEQIKLIDAKRKSVDELEEDTNKRLHDINKKIMNTKTAHKMAKHLVDVAEGVEGGNTEEKTSRVREVKNAKMKSGQASTESNDIEESLGKIRSEEDKQTQVKGNYEDIPEETEDDVEIKSGKKKVTSQLVSTMLSSLKEQVLKLNKDLKSNDIGKGSSQPKDKSNSDKKEIDAEGLENNQKGLGTLVDVLKKEMQSLKKLREKNDGKLSMEADEKGIVEETEKDIKDNMEVRIRTLDEKAFDSEFDDENLREDVKEATKKMEDDVRKQLKEAGLNFKDNIKIKIITTKDKFDQFSKGKGVKLLSEDDAADFKDLLLGFLGGGKEKVKEEHRLQVLENNYNFVYDDEDDGADKETQLLE